jgi:hypothetical protein
MPRPQRDQVVVIADPMADDGIDRYRHCYWQDVLPITKDDIYAIDDHPPAGELYGRTYLLVISYDSANGDPAFKSDVTLQYLETQARVRIHELLADGGTVLAECQTAQGVPVQKAYDAIFGGGELSVSVDVPPEGERRGASARIAKRFANHPLLVGMPGTVHENYQPAGERIFYDRFAKNPPDSSYIFDKHKHSLWFGWFSWWGRDWVPLLYADVPHSYRLRNGRGVGPAPILLAKVERNGLLLASTMWLAGARCTQLIENAADARLDEVRRCHRSIMRKRVLGDLTIGLALVAALVGLLQLLIETAIRPDNFAFTWLLSVAGVGFVSAAIASWQWFIKSVWRRPHGVNILRSLGRSARAKMLDH